MSSVRLYSASASQSLRRIARRLIAECMRSLPPSVTGGGRNTAVTELLQRLATKAYARVGVAALHLESGLKISLNATDRFPMASTVKLPIAVQLLGLIDEEVVNPETLIAIKPNHIHPGHGLIGGWMLERFRVPGVALSVQNLFDLMLTVSDNSAADMLLNLVGGPSAVVDRLRSLGINDISIDRSTLQLLADSLGVEAPTDIAVTPHVWRLMRESIPHARRLAARRAFFIDPRDTVTPHAMVDLLAAIARSQAISADGTKTLLDTMARCGTGPDRLKRILPYGTRVAHKTGSLRIGVVNDCGIVTLPNYGGRVALAVFITEADSSVEDMEWLIARIARTLVWYFLRHASPPSL